ncbi:MAG: hypothetical protein C0410_05650 [Anaerolinea sp.]|nr:hypothetical protein [Anaerolinea sp.]
MQPPLFWLDYTLNSLQLGGCRVFFNQKDCVFDHIFFLAESDGQSTIFFWEKQKFLCGLIWQKCSHF